jgi:aspartate aminotransferase
MTAGKFNEAMENIRMSPIVAISEEAKGRAAEFEKSGRSFLTFQRGEIDFPTPPYIVDALKEGVDKGLTRYPRSGGEGYFKDAVLKKMAEDHGVDDLTGDHIVATYGGQEGLELSFKLFSSGAGFSPTWSCVLENFVPFAQIDFVEVPLNEDFSVDYDLLERTVQGRDFFYLNNPQNPTGKVFGEDELVRIVEICTRHGCYIVSDESYEKIVYDGREHYSLSKIRQDNIITVFTLSKTYAMTGWRLGYTISRDEHVAKLLRLGNYTQTAGVTTFLQYAGAAALSDRKTSNEVVSAMMAEFGLRRNALYDGLKDLPGVRIARPEGAFYMFPNFSEVMPAKLTGDERRKYIYNKLLEHGICTVYGSCFGRYFDDNIRLSFSGTPLPVIEELIGRFREIFA